MTGSDELERRTVVRRAGRRTAAILTGLPLLLAGCGSIGETLGDFNPLRKEEKILPGERSAFFPTTTAMSDEGARAASIGAPQTAGDWPQPGGNPRNDVGHLAFAGSGARVWKANVGGTVGGGVMSFSRGVGRIASRPVAANGNVYVYSPDGTVTALSLASGNRIWSTKLKPERENDPAPGGGVAVSGDKLFVSSGYGMVTALSASNGKVQWTKEFDTPPRSAPTAAEGKVFIVTQDNQIFAVDQEDGGEAFSFAGVPELAGLLSPSSPAVADNTVVVPTTSGELIAFDISEGAPKWLNTVSRSARTLAISGLSDIAGSPVIHGGTVYATGVGGRTIAAALKDGKLLWESDLGSASTPVVSGDAVFIIDLDNRMVALDKSDGTILWATPLPRPEKKRDKAWSGPLLAGNALWAISNDGRLAALDPVNGQLRSDKDVGISGFSSPILAGGRMIIVSDAGEVSAFQ